eukprot:1157343-Pelagomonas_calceolata.AAC.5
MGRSIVRNVKRSTALRKEARCAGLGWISLRIALASSRIASYLGDLYRGREHWRQQTFPVLKQTPRKKCRAPTCSSGPWRPPACGVLHSALPPCFPFACPSWLWRLSSRRLSQAPGAAAVAAGSGGLATGRGRQQTAGGGLEVCEAKTGHQRAQEVGVC